LLVFAQLRDVLAAENSAVMAKEDQHCRGPFPERSKTHIGAVCVWKADAGERFAKRKSHVLFASIYWVLLRPESGQKSL
jgi:hypothetical protein